MRTIPVYSDYKVTMECVKVEIDRQHYILITPKTRELVVDEKVTYDNYVEVKIVDETDSTCLIFEATTYDLAQHIKVIQDLMRQVNNLPKEPEQSQEDTDLGIVYPNDDSCGLNYTNNRSNVIKRSC